MYIMAIGSIIVERRRHCHHLLTMAAMIPRTIRMSIWRLSADVRYVTKAAMISKMKIKTHEWIPSLNMILLKVSKRSCS